MHEEVIKQLEKQSEPVAWLCNDGVIAKYKTDYYNIPLYTTPHHASDVKQTKPLSNADLDIEIVKLAQGKHATMRDMLRAIEAKVRGEK